MNTKFLSRGQKPSFQGLRETQGSSLGIDADAGLVGEQFRRLVAGRDPVEDRFLRGVGVDRDGRVGRAGGIDVVFSAPKSVSVAWAVGGPQTRAVIEAAQDAAVARAVAYLRERVPTARPRSGGGTREFARRPMCWPRPGVIR